MTLDGVTTDVLIAYGKVWQGRVGLYRDLYEIDLNHIRWSGRRGVPMADESIQANGVHEASSERSRTHGQSTSRLKNWIRIVYSAHDDEATNGVL